MILSVLFIGCGGDDGGGGGETPSAKPGKPSSGDGDDGGREPPVVQARKLGTHTFARVNSSNGFSCALIMGGGVKCWGYQNSGRLGDGVSASTYAIRPVDVLGVGGTGTLKGVVQISMKSASACALTVEGTVACWGAGGDHLGNGTSNDTSHPTMVLEASGKTNLLGNIIQVAKGTAHTCALTGSGTVKCWGNGSVLGDGVGVDSGYPVDVVEEEGSTDPLEGVVQISAGDNHVCVLMGSGSVKCWGTGRKGILGHGSTDNETAPVNVVDAEGSPLTDIIQIDAGVAHSCALNATGGVRCWGNQSSGALGNGETGSGSVSNAVVVLDVSGSAPLGGIVQISAGSSFSCALTGEGTVLCWGKGDLLGSNASSNSGHPVVVVEGSGNSAPLADIVQIDSYDHTCGVTTKGEIRCWGKGSSGELGTGAQVSKTHPVSVVDGGSTLFNIGKSSGYEYSCYSDNSCRFEENSLITVTPSDGPEGTDTTPDVLVGNVSAGDMVTLHLDATCTSSSIGSGTVASGETTATITPTTALVAWENLIYAKVGNLCSANPGIYTLTGADPRVVGEIRGMDATPTLTINHLSNGDSISLHGSRDCSDGALGSATASGATGSLTPSTALEGRRHVFHLKQNGTCYPDVFEYELITFRGSYGLIATGSDHSCAVNAGGGVFCWGAGGQGQLGNDDTAGKDHPVTVVDGDSSTDPLKDIVQVVAGGSHTCALTLKGTVKCWGDGNKGRLGNGSTADVDKDHPVDVVGVGGSGVLSGIVQIGAGYNHTCGVTDKGAVVCWGIGDNGRLGNNSAVNSGTPVEVLESDGNSGTIPLKGAVEVKGGIEHTCALTSEGTVKCWGKGQNGQLGNGGTAVTQSTAVDALVSNTDQTPLGDIVQISTGGYHTCALTSGGNVKCWGRDLYGELSNVETGQQTYPTDMTIVGSTLIEGVKAISAGESHTCILGSRNNISCSGRNNQGQLGSGSTTDQNNLITVRGTRHWVGLSAKKTHTCALRESGEVKCWGFNFYGQLGNDNTTRQNEPASVVEEDSSTIPLSIGNWEREYVCYGDGTCEFDRETFAVPLLSSPADGDTYGLSFTLNFTISNVKSFQSVSLHEDAACASDASASGAVANGGAPLTLTSSTLNVSENAFFIKVGDSCHPHRTDYIVMKGTLDNRIEGDALSDDTTPTLTVNRLANGDTLSLHSGKGCSGNTVASATATGSSEDLTVGSGFNYGINTLYLKKNGVCYPRRFDYNLVYLIADYHRIAEGGTHTCVVNSDAGVYCWGLGASGQLGNDGTANVDHPVRVVSADGSGTNLGNIIQVSSGLEHTCALTSAGKVKCWGEADQGQLGNNATADKDAPVDVITSGTDTNALGGIVQISAGNDHTCALTQKGTLVCWGKNDNGRLGNDCNDSCADTPHPVKVKASDGDAALLSSVIQVSAGGHHTCGIVVGGRVVCWGWGGRGQLGNTTASDKDAPSPVRAVSGDGDLEGVVQISAGIEHTCGVTNAGTIVCWGSGGHGRLGHNATSSSNRPVYVQTSSSDTDPLDGVLQVGAGDEHSCALAEPSGGNYGFFCWGNGNNGRLSDRCFSSTCANQTTPTGTQYATVPSNGVAKVIQIGRGNNHTCLLFSGDGVVQCWGAGSTGRLGSNQSNDQDSATNVAANGSGGTLSIGTTMRRYICSVEGCEIASE